MLRRAGMALFSHARDVATGAAAPAAVATKATMTTMAEGASAPAAPQRHVPSYATADPWTMSGDAPATAQCLCACPCSLFLARRC
jgi:hypothetical protein